MVAIAGAAKILAEAIPFLEGTDNLHVLKEGQRNDTTTTAAITTKIAPEKEQKFLEWQALIAPIQSHFPGFLGYRLVRPQSGEHGEWVAIVTFDSDEHLEGWMQSREKKVLAGN